MLNATRLFLGLMTGSLVLAGSAQAAPPRPTPIPARPIVYPNRGMQMMPGQDWWRIYPWSAYNAWRNIYWYPPYNGNYPFPPSQAYPGSYMPPVIVPTTMPVPEQEFPAERPAVERREETRVPHPTGALKVAPPDAAVLRVDVSDAFATVTFDGQKVSSVGTTRYYVTPTLQAGKNQQYTIAVVNRGGQQTTLERRVDVTPGQVVTVDFAKSR
jgi:uncharacterized protein (TIGR03000 family)